MALLLDGQPNIIIQAKIHTVKNLTPIGEYNRSTMYACKIGKITYQVPLQKGTNTGGRGSRGKCSLALHS